MNVFKMTSHGQYQLLNCAFRKQPGPVPPALVTVKAAVSHISALPSPLVSCKCIGAPRRECPTLGRFLTGLLLEAV